MMKSQIQLREILSTVLIFSIIGGVLLIAVTKLSTIGLIQMIPYPIVMIAALLALKFNKKTELNYLKSFVTGGMTFIIMSLVLYFYIGLYVNPDSGITIWGHIWRMLAILGSALVSGAILALFFRK